MPDVAEDVGEFAERVMRRPLWPHQLQAARSRAFVTAVAGARRTGKTELAQTLAVHTALRNPGAKVVIVSMTAPQARVVTQDVAALLVARKITRDAVVDDFATRITFKNGAAIISIPAQQARGLGKGVLLVIFDEAGHGSDDDWTAIRYIALDERERGSRVLLIGTPWGDGFFRRAFAAGREGADDDYAAFQWPYTANPRLDHAYLERERDRNISPPEFASQVLGEWSDAVGALFSSAVLDAHTAHVSVALPW